MHALPGMFTNTALIWFFALILNQNICLVFINTADLLSATAFLNIADLSICFLIA